jgi:hypothetical protein
MIGVGVALVVALAVVPVGAEPTGTIGVGDVEVLVEAEPDEDLAGGGFWPLGMTIGVDDASPPPPPLPPLPPLPLVSPPLSLPESELSCGGQSTDFGGQLSVLPDPDEPPGGAQPAPAPKSPAVVQSASAMPTGSRATDPASTTAAAAVRQRRVDIREALTA